MIVIRLWNHLHHVPTRLKGVCHSTYTMHLSESRPNGELCMWFVDKKGICTTEEALGPISIPCGSFGEPIDHGHGTFTGATFNLYIIMLNFPSSSYRFWLPLWYLPTLLLPSIIAFPLQHILNYGPKWIRSYRAWELICENFNLYIAMMMNKKLNIFSATVHG